MKNIIITFFCFLSIQVFSQQQITLKQAIAIAQEKSPEYKALINQNQASYWRYRNYKAGFLPQLRLQATLPQYRNSVNRIVLDDGSDDFRRSNQIRFDGSISLNQNIALTGGTISVSSQLERIDRFEPSESTGFAVIPFSLNYNVRYKKF